MIACLFLFNRPRAQAAPKKLRPLQPTPPSSSPPDRSIPSSTSTSTSTLTSTTSGSASSTSTSTATTNEMDAIRRENVELRERLNMMSATLKQAPKTSTSLTSTAVRVPRRQAKAVVAMVEISCQTDLVICEECPKRRVELLAANRNVSDLKTEVKRLSESTNQLTEQITNLVCSYILTISGLTVLECISVVIDCVIE
jgi:hypothetical protein